MTVETEEVVIQGVVWIIERHIDKNGVVITENSYPKARS